MTVLVWVFQKTEPIRWMDTDRSSRMALSITQLSIEIYSYYKKLVHMIVETEQSKAYSQQAGDPGELMGQFQSESQSLRTERADGISESMSPSLMAPKDQSSSLKTVRQRERTLSYSTFYSIWAFSRLDKAHQPWEGNLFHSIY